MQAGTLPPSVALPVNNFSVDQVLSPYVYVFYAAFLMSFAFTPVMRLVAHYYGVIDRPDAARKIHRADIAYLGGVAIFLGWLAGLAISQFQNVHNDGTGIAVQIRIHFGIVCAAFVMLVTGLLDDVHSIRPRYKILGQVVAAVTLLVSGVGTHLTKPLLDPIDLRLKYWHVLDSGLPSWVIVGSSCLLTIALVVFCCNSTNLLDGLDGLCSGVTAIIAAGYLFIIVFMAKTALVSDTAQMATMLTLSVALLATVLGFLPYNFNPASIFMGDTGSMFLGFSISLLIVLMGEFDTRWLLAGVVMFALPVLDTSLAFARRYVNGRPMFSADKMHVHHQILSRVLTVRKTVVISYLMTLGFVLLGVSIIYVRSRFAVAIYMVVFAFIIVAAYKMGMVHEKPKVVTRNPIGGLDAADSDVSVSGVLDIRDAGANSPTTNR